MNAVEMIRRCAEGQSGRRELSDLDPRGVERYEPMGTEYLQPTDSGVEGHRDITWEETGEWA